MIWKSITALACWESNVAKMQNGRLRLRMAVFTSASRSLARMIAGWLPWEIDCSHFSPQSQSTWSPHLPPTSSLPPPSQSAALTQSLAGSLADFTREKERTLRWQKREESEDTGDPSGPAVCRLLMSGRASGRRCTRHCC